MQRIIDRLALVAALVFAATTHAEEIFDLERLQQYFSQPDKRQAYEYASAYREVYEGDPYFDYYYGVAAIDSGKVSEGVFALERVLIAFPDDPVATLELARGYYILEEYSRAR